MFELLVTEHNEALVLTPRLSRLDALSAPTFRQVVSDAIAGKTLAVLSFEYLQFMDSSGLGALITVLKSIPAGGGLKIVKVPRQVQALIQITGLAKVFPSYDSVGAALAA